MLKLVPPTAHLLHRRPAIVDNDVDSTGIPTIYDDDLALGASASPVEPENLVVMLPIINDESTSSTNDQTRFQPCE